MKKLFLNILLFTFLFVVPACSCSKEKTLTTEEATEVLKETSVSENVEVTTTTETIVNGTQTTSTQVDTYYGDKYYHTSEADNLTTKTWYGSVNDTLYAFYYTKNANSEEVKTSSRIETALLDSTKNQINSLITNLFDESGNLLEKYTITGTQKMDDYTLQISSNTQDESDVYTITIKNTKLHKIVKNSNILDNSIKTTYEYNYNVTDFSLPSLNEYPLVTNG